jgi:hypothetical protein
LAKHSSGIIEAFPADAVDRLKAEFARSAAVWPDGLRNDV